MSINLIHFKNIWSIREFIPQISFLNELKRGETTYIQFDFDADVIMPEYLVIIISAINDARLRGVNVLYPDYDKRATKLNEIYKNNKSRNSYASRMNFFKLLGIKYNEYYVRRNPNDNFIEITKMDISTDSYHNDIALVNKIMKIFDKHIELDNTVLRVLNFCLWELIDNINNHSNSESYTIVAQYYPSQEAIRLCLIDNGIGVYKALTETEGTKYSYFTPKEALTKCTDASITDGKGAGFGLYSFKKFVEENKGHLIIHSGDYCQELKQGKTNVYRCPHWQGTIVYCKIKTKNKVDYNRIFGKAIPTTVEEYKESIYKLW